jgi:hypothetical protein
MGLRALVVAAILPCVGCVSVFEGTSQDIHVVTVPVGATCVFERQGQPIGTIVNTPGVLNVRKSKYDITIKCTKPGYQEAAYLNHSGVSGAIAANIVVDVLLTAGVASIVDSATGADNKYDSVVNIMLPPVGPAEAAPAQAAPAQAVPLQALPASAPAAEVAPVAGPTAPVAAPASPVATPAAAISAPDKAIAAPDPTVTCHFSDGGELNTTISSCKSGGGWVQ